VCQFAFNIASVLFCGVAIGTGAGFFRCLRALEQRLDKVQNELCVISQLNTDLSRRVAFLEQQAAPFSQGVKDGTDSTVENSILS